LIDIDANLKEIKYLNLFAQAKISILANSRKSFKDLNYKFIVFPKFPNKENDVDFLLYNPELAVALLIEIKGGASVEEEDIEQIKSYQKHSIKELKIVLERLEIENPKINNFYTGIVYPKSTIESCNCSQECKERLERIKKDFILMTMEAGGELNALNPKKINWDSNLKKELDSGINLPKYPKKEILFNDKPNYKIIIIGLIDYLFTLFNSEIKGNIWKSTLDSLRIQLSEYRIQRRNLKKAINFLRDKNYIKADTFKNLEFERKKIEELYYNRSKFISKIKSYKYGELEKYFSENE